MHVGLVSGVIVVLYERSEADPADTDRRRVQGVSRQRARLIRKDGPAHCAAETEPMGLPRIVIPSGKGLPATLKLRATSSARRRR